MPDWVVIRIPGKKMPRLRGPYYSGVRAERIKEEAEEQGLVAKIYPTSSHNEAQATEEIKEQMSDREGIVAGAGNIRHAYDYEEED